MNASVTPVRDALHRLTGERLLEAPRHEGFRVPILSETMLRHLYAWHLDLLLVAIGGRRAKAAEWSENDPEAANAERMFARVAAASHNPEHAAAFRNVTERLEPYQRFECDFLDSTADETNQIFTTLRNRDIGGLRRALVRYHRRRERIVPQLLAELCRHP